ncbi:hypothetical protein FXB41_18845 [Bradyrhizobium canariense]|nr:hypothetical protein [Bradyrhizobium canariense]
MGTRAGNRANHRPYEGCGVSSVVSRDMAAGSSALSAMNVHGREPAPRSAMDQLQHARRFTTERFDDGRRGDAIRAGTAVSRQKHTEILFGGAAASCYPQRSMGAKRVVTTTSHRPN